MSTYTPTTYVDSSSPDVDATNINHAEAGVDTAHAELAAHLAASPLDHPDSSVDDTAIGNRSADVSQQPNTVGPGTLTEWLSWVANRIKAAVGGAAWYSTPATNLAAAASHHANTSNPHSVTAAQAGVWTSSNDGTGSGLDADKLGGIARTEILRFRQATYVGDGTEDRAIIVGFQPLMVWVRKSGGNKNGWLSENNTRSTSFDVESTGKMFSSGMLYLNADGFVVGNEDGNENGVTYTYNAMGTIG